jgi:histidine triad (HIT) family protein
MQQKHNTTIFEKIISGEVPSTRIYDDKNFSAFLDAFPTSPGHTLIVPKKPYADLFEIPEELAENMLPVVKMLSEKIKEALKADGIKIIMNNGKASGQEVFHAHIHIIPRFDNDGWPNKIKYSEGEAEEIAKKIKKELQN